MARGKLPAKVSSERPTPDGGRHTGGRGWLLLAGILLVGLLLRAAYLSEFVGAPDFDSPGVDPGFHDYWARGLAFGDWTPPRPHPDPQIGSRPFLRPPGYPYFLALIYKLVGTGYLGPRVIQMALGLVNCVLAFWFARRWFGRGVGLVWAGFMAGYWIFIYYEGQFHEPVLLVFLLLLLINVLGSWAEKLALGYALAAGLLLGLAALVRANALLFIPAALVWGVWVGYRRCGRRRSCAAVMVLLVGSAATIGPVTIRNYVVAGEFVLISTNAGINLLIGNNQEARGMFVRQLGDVGEFRTCYDYPRLLEDLEAKLGRPVTHAQASSYFAGQAFRFMAEHPGRAVQLMLKKGLLFWGPYEISHNKEVHYEREYSRVLRRVPGGFAAVAALFVLGLALWLGELRRRKKSPRAAPPPIEGQVRMAVLVLLIIVVYFISYLPFFVTALYRVPVIPFLFLFGAYAVHSVWRLALAGEFRRTITWVLIGVVLYALAGRSVIPYQPDLAHWHYSRAFAHQRKGEVEPALGEYRRSLEVRPGYFEGLVGLGRLLVEQGQVAEGSNRLAAALRLKPDFVDGHVELGSALRKRGFTQEAAGHLQEALRLRPGSVKAHVEMGSLLSDQGRFEEALGHFEEALRVDPDSFEAHNNIANQLVRRGRTAQAVEHFNQALRLEPDNVVLRTNLGIALTQLGQVERAIETFTEALRLDARDPLAHASLGMALQRSGRLDQAIEHFSEAARLAPDNAEVRYRFAAALEQAGQDEEARAQYGEVLRLDPQHPLARARLEALGKSQPR